MDKRVLKKIVLVAVCVVSCGSIWAPPKRSKVVAASSGKVKDEHEERFARIEERLAAVLDSINKLSTREANTTFLVSLQKYLITAKTIFVNPLDVKALEALNKNCCSFQMGIKPQMSPENAKTLMQIFRKWSAQKGFSPAMHALLDGIDEACLLYAAALIVAARKEPEVGDDSVSLSSSAEDDEVASVVGIADDAEPKARLKLTLDGGKWRRCALSASGKEDDSPGIRYGYNPTLEDERAAEEFFASIRGGLEGARFVEDGLCSAIFEVVEIIVDQVAAVECCASGTSLSVAQKRAEFIRWLDRLYTYLVYEFRDDSSSSLDPYLLKERFGLQALWAQGAVDVDESLRMFRDIVSASVTCIVTRNPALGCALLDDLYEGLIAPFYVDTEPSPDSKDFYDAVYFLKMFKKAYMLTLSMRKSVTRVQCLVKEYCHDSRIPTPQALHDATVYFAGAQELFVERGLPKTDVQGALVCAVEEIIQDFLEVGFGSSDQKKLALVSWLGLLQDSLEEVCSERVDPHGLRAMLSDVRTALDRGRYDAVSRVSGASLGWILFVRPRLVVGLIHAMYDGIVSPFYGDISRDPRVLAEPLAVFDCFREHYQMPLRGARSRQDDVCPPMPRGDAKDGVKGSRVEVDEDCSRNPSVLKGMECERCARCMERNQFFSSELKNALIEQRICGEHGDVNTCIGEVVEAIVSDFLLNQCTSSKDSDGLARETCRSWVDSLQEIVNTLYPAGKETPLCRELQAVRNDAFVRGRQGVAVQRQLASVIASSMAGVLCKRPYLAWGLIDALYEKILISFYGESGAISDDIKSAVAVLSAFRLAGCKSVLEAAQTPKKKALQAPKKKAKSRKKNKGAGGASPASASSESVFPTEDGLSGAVAIDALTDRQRMALQLFFTHPGEVKKARKILAEQRAKNIAAWKRLCDERDASRRLRVNVNKLLEPELFESKLFGPGWVGDTESFVLAIDRQAKKRGQLDLVCLALRSDVAAYVDNPSDWRLAELSGTFSSLVTRLNTFIEESSCASVGLKKRAEGIKALLSEVLIDLVFKEDEAAPARHPILQREMVFRANWSASDASHDALAANLRSTLGTIVIKKPADSSGAVLDMTVEVL